MKKKDKIGLGIIIIAIIIILCLIFYILNMKKDSGNSDTVPIDDDQSSYVEPETPIDRSQNVTLPGWGSFTIAADTTTITSGFEFHNPAANYWFEDTISIEGKDLEKLVVDSGNAVELNHYLKLAGIDSNVTSVKSYDKKHFTVEKNSDGNYTLEAIGGGFNGNKEIEVEAENGKTYTLNVSCASDCYYMTFALYLSDGDELLYQSGLVSHGNYIQKMELTRALKAGSYDAYVVIQPYKSDMKTETNSGVVNIVLNVQ